MKQRKKLKNLFALVFTLVIVLSGICGKAVVSQAAEINAAQKGTLNITKNGESAETPLAGAEFTIYKVYDLAKAGDRWSYTPTAGFGTALNGVSADALGNYSTAELEALADKLAETAKTLTGTSLTTGTDGVASFTNLDLGYYLIVETKAPTGYVAGKPFMVAIPTTNSDGTDWEYVVNASPKNSKVSIEKTVTGDTDGTVTVGDTLNFTINTKIPNYEDAYFAEGKEVVFKITDTMSTGLTWNKDSINVTVGGTPVTAGTSTFSLEKKEDGFVLAFAKAYLQNPDNKGKAVVVTYSANVNENAVTGTNANTNKAILEYNNSPGTTDDADKTVKVYSFNIEVVKFWDNSGVQTALDGAKFELHKGTPDGALVETAKITDESGKISFGKLTAGTYYLVETEAPDGYTLLANPIKVEIKEVNAETGAFKLLIDGKEVTAATGDFVSHKDVTNGTAVVAVENYKGFTLPKTGGMGIALFLGVGIVGMFAVIVMMKRKANRGE